MLDNDIAQSCACTQRSDSQYITKLLLKSSRHLLATYEKCPILKQLCLCMIYVLFFLSPRSSLLTTFAWKIASSFFKKFIHSCCCYFFFFSALELIILSLCSCSGMLWKWLWYRQREENVAAAEFSGGRLGASIAPGNQRRNQMGSCHHLKFCCPQ